MTGEMKKFLESLKSAAAAMSNMSLHWEMLGGDDDAIVQMLGWSEAFSISLDEVPLVMWGISDLLEDILTEEK